MEVRALRRADETLPQTHGSQTVPVSRLRAQLLPLRPPGVAQETPPLGVKTYRRATLKDTLVPGFVVELCYFDFDGVEVAGLKTSGLLTGSGELFLRVHVSTLSPH